MSRWACGVTGLPPADVAKPHCGLTASRSAPTSALACRSLASMSAARSSAEVFVVTRPSTMTLSSGTRRSGSKLPERSSSYSSSSRSACTRPNTGAAIGS